jgi:hypothetical protein
MRLWQFLYFLCVCLISFWAVAGIHKQIKSTVQPSLPGHQLLAIDDLEAAEQPQGFKALQEAVKKIEISASRTDTSGQCTATVISPDGYILTALHCLDLCLEIQTVDWPEASHMQLIKTDQNRNLHRSCDVTLNGGHTHRAEVIALGRGHIRNYDARVGLKRNGAKFLSWINEGYGLSSDYVILKLSGESDMACAKISSKGLHSGDSVWTETYPAPIRRIDGSVSPRGEMLYSNGSITSLGHPGACKGKVGSAENFSSLGIWSGNLFIGPGSSGSPLFNSGGELAGMITDKTSLSNSAGCQPVSSGSTNGIYDGGLANGILLQKIIQNIRNDFGAEVVKQAFNCH